MFNIFNYVIYIFKFKYPLVSQFGFNIPVPQIYDMFGYL